MLGGFAAPPQGICAGSPSKAVPRAALPLSGHWPCHSSGPRDRKEEMSG